MKPLFAKNRIVYGKAKIAPPRSLFVPTSSLERAECIALGAAREPTDEEMVLAGHLGLIAADAADAADDKPKARRGRPKKSEAVADDDVQGDDDDAAADDDEIQ